jgi:hypothetical protein
MLPENRFMAEAASMDDVLWQKYWFSCARRPSMEFHARSIV